MRATKASKKTVGKKVAKAKSGKTGRAKSKSPLSKIKTLKVRKPLTLRTSLAAYRAVPMTRIITPPGRLLPHQGISERVLVTICALAFVVGFLGVGAFHIVQITVTKQIHHADTSVVSDMITPSGDSSTPPDQTASTDQSLAPSSDTSAPATDNLLPTIDQTTLPADLKLTPIIQMAPLAIVSL
jgi:hypothetical protein